MFLNLYKSMARPRPHLHYAIQDWFLIYKKKKKKKKKKKIVLENVQRRGTKLVKSIKSLIYDKRLRHLGFSTLEY